MINKEVLTYIILVLCIVSIFLLIWNIWQRRRPNDKDRRRKAIMNYKKSISDDEYAKIALSTIREIAEPTAGDLYRAGNLIEINDAGDNRPNINMIQMAARDYIDAMQIIRRPEFQITIQQIQNERAQEYEPDTEFILDHIENFIDLTDVIPALFNNLRLELYQTRQVTAEQKRTQAAEISSTKKEFADAFLDISKTATDDPQNVHDPSVVKDFNATLKTVADVDGAAASQQAISDARKYIESLKLSAEKLKIVTDVLNKIAENNFILTYNQNEADIFAKIWNRANIPENLHNADLIREAIVDALYNCYENSAMICAVGRASNIISSLVTLDHNDEVGRSMTQEQYKNEIFNECRKLLDRKIAAAESGEYAQVAAAFKNPQITAPAEIQKKFDDELSRDVQMLIEKYKDKINEKILKNIYADCLIAVGTN